MNKKAISYGAVMKIPDLLFLVIAFSVVLLLIGLHIKTDVETFPVESDITAIRLLYSALAYQDPDTGRIFPGIIDLDKFNTAYLEKAIVMPAKYMPIELVFKDQKVYLDEENFKDNWAARFVKGKGRININEINIYTLARQTNSKLFSGKTKIIITQKT